MCPSNGVLFWFWKRRPYGWLEWINWHIHSHTIAWLVHLIFLMINTRRKKYIQNIFFLMVQWKKNVLPVVHIMCNVCVIFIQLCMRMMVCIVWTCRHWLWCDYTWVEWHAWRVLEKYTQTRITLALHSQLQHEVFLSRLLARSLSLGVCVCVCVWVCSTHFSCIRFVHVSLTQSFSTLLCDFSIFNKVNHFNSFRIHKIQYIHIKVLCVVIDCRSRRQRK